MVQFKAVLFDFDGTLADTMRDHFNAWKSALSGYGVDISEADFYPHEGLDMVELGAKFLKKSPVPGDLLPNPLELIQIKEAVYLAYSNFKLYPGVKETLDYLRTNNIRAGVVTAGRRPRLEKTVPIGFFENFDVIITGENCINSKPHPEPYLRAAENLGIKAMECVVIENSPYGVQSSKEAGSYCIAIA